MQLLEVSGAVRTIYGSLGVKRLRAHHILYVSRVKVKTLQPTTVFTKPIPPRSSNFSSKVCDVNFLYRVLQKLDKTYGEHGLKFIPFFMSGKAIRLTPVFTTLNVCLISLCKELPY